MGTFQDVVLGFDFGEVRIGVAVGNGVTASSNALAIAELIREWQPAVLVVGEPRHLDGRPHEVTAMARKFARSLAGRFNLPVYMADERYTSVEAERRVSPGSNLDAEAAAVILEQWFMEGCPERRPENDEK